MPIKNWIIPILRKICFSHSQDRLRNIDFTRKLIFIHNPKCAGTSLRKALGFDIRGADHRYPDEYISQKEWESFFTICVVREPISRLISSYRYHCLSEYSGHYTKKYPMIKEWSLEKYFENIKSGLVVGMGLQKKFVTHSKSKLPINCLLQFEDLDYSVIPKSYFKSEVRPMNTGTQRKADPRPIEISKNTFKAILDFYREDYCYFPTLYPTPKSEDVIEYGLNVT